MGEPRSGRARRPATALDGSVNLARDRALVERSQAGDDGAFAELYGRYRRRLHRACLHRLHDADDAEEAVQEAFTRAWRALPHFEGERRFYPWLTVIAANVCTDVLRRRSRLVPMDPMGQLPVRAADASQGDVGEALLRQIDMGMAIRALARLSERHRRVLRLRTASGWSAQQIAEHEGIPVPAVDTLMWRARKALPRELAALSDAAEQLAVVAGGGFLALRRAIARTGTRAARMGTLSSWPPPRPGALAGALVLAGATLAGGGALVATGGLASHPPATIGAPAAASAPGSGSGSGLGPPGTGISADAAAGSRPVRSDDGGAGSPPSAGRTGSAGGTGSAAGTDSGPPTVGTGTGAATAQAPVTSAPGTPGASGGGGTGLSGGSGTSAASSPPATALGALGGGLLSTAGPALGEVVGGVSGGLGGVVGAVGGAPDPGAGTLAATATSIGSTVNGAVGAVTNAAGAVTSGSPAGSGGGGVPGDSSGSPAAGTGSGLLGGLPDTVGTVLGGLAGGSG